MVLRMASTATSSALWRSPKPMGRAAAMAAFSTTRRNSRLSCSSILAPSADANLRAKCGLRVDRSAGSDGANPTSVQGNHTPIMGSLYLFFARKWTDKSVDEIRIRKLGHLAGVFFLNGEQAGGGAPVVFFRKGVGNAAGGGGDLLEGVCR